jgi:hypothetical protein
VSALERDVAKRGLERAAAFADIDDLVPLRIPVEKVVFAIGLCEKHRDVRVVEQRDAIDRQAAARRELVRPEVAMTELPFWIALPFEIAQGPDRLHRRRLMQVVEQRRGAGEALVADQFLGVEPAIGFPEDRVPLMRHLAKLMVDRHVV